MRNNGEPVAEKPTAFFGNWRDKLLFDSIGPRGPEALDEDEHHGVVM